MLQSLYNALAGMRAQQTCIDVIGNNVANINTLAFKSGRTDFADALYSQMKRPRESGEYLQQGCGIIVGAVQRMQLQGTSAATGNPLDFMIDGAGFFVLQGPGGQRYYTRDGSFKVSMENGVGYLVSAEGYHVLGGNNQPIRLPGDASAIASDLAGNLVMNGTAFASLAIAAFANPAGLTDAGGNKYQLSEASGQAAAAAGRTVRQGWLEGSNVDMAGEMARLILAQKAFSAMGTAVRTADDMESMANNLTK